MENTEKEKRFVILGKTSNGGGGGGGEGTVTSVGISVPTGLNVIGSPVTSSGIIQIGFANGYSIPTTAKQAEWDAKSDFSGSYNDLTNKPTLATVATSGDYDDLTNKPTIPSKTSDLTNDSGFVIDTSLSSVATSGSYNDLTDTPTIPTVGNGTITITQGGVTKGTFTTNQSGNSTIALDAGGGSGTQVQSDWTETDSTSMAYILHKPTIPTKTSDLTNDSGFISQLKTINNESLIGTGNLTIDTFSGDYNDLSNKPTIPTKTSDLTNDSGFVVGSNLATVATSGSYNDLSDTPTIPTNTSDLTNDSGFINQLKTINNESLIGTGNITIGSGGTQVQSDWTETDSTSMAYILHKPTLSTVATTGDYDDLTNKPTIPTKTSDLTNDSGFISQIKTINNESLIGTGNLTIDTFSGDYNDLTNKPTIPTKTSDLTNDSNFVVGSTLATVATSGSYNDLTNRPTIPTKTSDLTNDSGFVVGSTLATVATSGSYNDLTNKPTIPTVGNGTITITQGGTTKGTFTLNQSGNATIALDAGGSGGGDVTADGDNTFTGINSFMNDVFIGGFTGDEGGSIAEEDHSLTVNSVNGSTYIGINQLSMSNTRGNQFSLVLTEEFDDELQEYNLQTIISTYNLNIVNPTEGATASVSIDGYQVLTTNDVATVATSGSYNDLTNKPTLATVATSGSYNDLTNKPTLATVATSGSYNDLTNKPSMSTETLTFIDDNNVSTTVVVYTQPTV